MRRGQRTFRPDNKEYRHTCLTYPLFLIYSRLLLQTVPSGFIGAGLCVPNAVSVVQAAASVHWTYWQRNVNNCDKISLQLLITQINVGLRLEQLSLKEKERKSIYITPFISERTTLRSLYAIGRPSVVCLSVVCLSVTLVHPTQAVELFGNFFHHTIAQGLYFSGAKNHWWGTPLSPWNLRSKWPTPLKQRNFDQYRLIAPQPWYLAKKVQLALIGSRPRAFQRAIDEPCTLPLSPPKGGTKTRYRCLCQ